MIDFDKRTPGREVVVDADYFGVSHHWVVASVVGGSLRSSVVQLLGDRTMPVCGG